MLPFLKQLISAPGLSGHEAPVRSLIEIAWRPLVDETHVSRLGSLHAVRRGLGPAPRPMLLMATHMDAIGLMVSGLLGGFLRLAPVGYLDARMLPGQLVTVHGREDLPGVVVLPPPHLLPQAEDGSPAGGTPAGGTPAVEHMLVDTGLPPPEIERLVRTGDLVSFDRPPQELNGGDYLSGHSLDNRASVAALTRCLELLQGRELLWDVCAAATVQEEETMAGARTSAYQVQPDLAVAIDVTFGRGPGSPNNRTFPLSEGPTLGWGPVIHPALHRIFKDLAAKLDIPYQPEIMPRATGTDGDYLQISRGGVPTMVVSIPLGYMHTPVEVVALRDIELTAVLLAEFAASLDGDFLEKLVWDD